jgi:hypothetical protein
VKPNFFLSAPRTIPNFTLELINSSIRHLIGIAIRSQDTLDSRLSPRHQFAAFRRLGRARRLGVKSSGPLHHARRAYKVTKDERYTTAFVEQLRSWRQQNPYGVVQTGRAQWKSRCGRSICSSRFTCFAVAAARPTISADGCFNNTATTSAAISSSRTSQPAIITFQTSPGCCGSA